MFEWFVSADQSLRLGDLASVLGLLISIIGFAIAIWRIWKSQKASEQTRIAVEAVKNDIQQMNSVQQVREAIAALEEIRRMHREKTWRILPDRYSLLKRNLIAIKARTPRISDQQRSTIQAAVQQLSLMEKQVEGVLSGDSTEPDIQTISKQIDRLGTLLAELQSEVG